MWSPIRLKPIERGAGQPAQTKPRKANLGAAAQANSFRPRYVMEMASPLNWVKPDTGDEEVGKGSRQTSRGGSRQRAGTDQPGTWEIRSGNRVERRSRRQRKDITESGPRPEVGEAHSSEEAGNAVEPRGLAGDEQK